MDWQPIETAPKDRRVLLYGGAPERLSEVVIGLWVEMFDRGWIGGGRGYVATHWMELPDEPAKQVFSHMEVRPGIDRAVAVFKDA